MKMRFTLFSLLLLVGCADQAFTPFEFFYNITSEKAVVISLLPGDSGVEMHTRVYPEDSEIGLGEVAERDDTRTLTRQETAEVRRLFAAVEFDGLDDDQYIPPLDASLWAVNTPATGENYATVLEPGELIAERNLTELMALGTYLWNLAGLEGDSY